MIYVRVYKILRRKEVRKIAIKLLIGGSPCTHWSIAQKNNRETEPSGMGWELFKNYLIAKEKFKPDFFLYENNKSAAQAIKDQIAKELGVGVDLEVRFTYINSALVSAQNRQRFYVTNFGDIEQPEDRGILLKDILETGTDLTQNRKSYCMTASYDGAVAWNTLERSQRSMVAEPVCHIIPQEVRVRKYSCDIDKLQSCLREHKSITNKKIAEVLGKPVTEVEHWFRTDKCFSIPDAEIWFDLKRLLGIETTEFDDFVTVFETREGVFEKSHRCYDINGKMSTLMTSCNDNIIEPIRVGCYPSPDGTLKNSQGMRLYNIEGKSVNITANGGGIGSNTGLYAIPVEFAGGAPVKAVSCADGKEYPVYEVKDGQITIKGKTYPIKLADGYYIIRKLTVTECCRLQTLPDDYCKAVSKTQGYKGLGNGWTAEVIIHLLNHALKDVPRNEEIVVLSLYDGIGTGRYCLDKMGFTNVKYYAYEIDKYPMAIANDNYPDIIQCGDAFAVREASWKPPKTRSEWLDELLEVTA